jgi:amino acid adenylation domain-containing protein
MPGLEAEYAWIYHDAARIDLHVNVMEDVRHGGALLEFAYRTALYNPTSVDRWVGALLSVLRQVVRDPDTSLHALQLLSPEESQQILAEWNDTRRDEIAADGLLHELFEAQAAARPAAPALSLGWEELSYGELDRQATALAGHLAGLGVGPEVRVGVCLERSFTLIVSLLGILKAGGVYVPLEPGQPRERLLFLLEDARIPLLLTRRETIEKLGDGIDALGTRALDVEAGLPQEGPAPAAGAAIDSDNLAYVIYTSGSTGKPNGVQVGHRSAVNLIRQIGEIYQVTPESRVAQVASLGFDVSVFEIFMALASGGCLCLFREEERLNPFLLSQGLARQRVTTAFFTPSELAIQSEASLTPVHRLGVGGEASSAELAARWSRDRHLLNCYGPTETAVFATCADLQDHDIEKPVPIGRPLANLEAHVIDSSFKAVPIGVIGELAVGGAAVARGYLDRFEKTALKFVPDPFAAVKGEPGARLYLTGDLVKRLADGRIIYLGRGDGQVKLRGRRIELGEIETVVASCPGVKETAVDVRGEGENQMLAAYVVWEDGADQDFIALRRKVESQLPHYMVPSSWIELRELPRSVNGKLDRLALRAKQQEMEEVPHVDPETPLERYLVDLWREVLRLDKLSLHDNFLEIGGNSINGAMLAYRLQEVLEETMHAIVIFDAPTVADMAHFLAVRYPDKVTRLWGEESLPDSVRAAMLEFEGMEEGDLEEMEMGV